MFIALDITGKRIDVNDAVNKNDYFCPICNGKLRIRDGKINIKHFAHISKINCDDFSSDMSEWHRKWQEQFPLKNREVVIEHNGEKHRADVLLYGHVIEFQHSPISLNDFERRNAFYTAAGKKVIWIFDLIEAHQKHLIRYKEDWRTGKLHGKKWVWDYSKKIFKNFLPQKENDVILFFQLFAAGAAPDYIARVISAVDEGDRVSFKTFNTSSFPRTKTSLLKWIKDRKNYDAYEAACYAATIQNSPSIQHRPLQLQPVRSSPIRKKQLSKSFNANDNLFSPIPTPAKSMVTFDAEDIPPKEEFLQDKYIQINGVPLALCTECNQIFPHAEMAIREWSRGQCRNCSRKQDPHSP